VLRTQVSFPARSDYPRLRDWLERLLRENPGLVLEDLALRRIADGGEELEVRITLGLLLAAQP